MAFCAKCGTQMNDGVKFCPACGTRVEVQAAAPQPQEAPVAVPVVAEAPRESAEKTAGVYQAPQQNAYQAPPQGAYQQGTYQQAQQGYQGNYQQAQEQYQQRAKPQQAAMEADKAAGYGAMAILAYSGILFLVPWLAGKESKFAQFHANQGLVLLLAGVAYSIAVGILTGLFTLISGGLGVVIGGLLGFVSIIFVVFSILGMINTCKGVMKPLPIIGGIQLIKS